MSLSSQETSCLVHKMPIYHCSVMDGNGQSLETCLHNHSCPTNFSWQRFSIWDHWQLTSLVQFLHQEVSSISYWRTSFAPLDSGYSLWPRRECSQVFQQWFEQPYDWSYLRFQKLFATGSRASRSSWFCLLCDYLTLASQHGMVLLSWEVLGDLILSSIIWHLSEIWHAFRLMSHLRTKHGLKALLLKDGLLLSIETFWQEDPLLSHWECLLQLMVSCNQLYKSCHRAPHQWLPYRGIVPKDMWKVELQEPKYQLGAHNIQFFSQFLDPCNWEFHRISLFSYR